MSHLCHAIGCRVEVKPELLCCYPHWRMVPKPIQRMVWAHYRRGQCDDKGPSPEWCAAADWAIHGIAVLEADKVPKKMLAYHLARGFRKSFYPHAPPIHRGMIYRACFPT